MGKRWCILIFLLAAPYSHAATIDTTGCSLVEVQAAVDEAAAGDIVSVPSGDCSWPSGITINKAITLQGSDSVITGSIGSGSSFITVIPVNDDRLTRITGFSFRLGNFNDGLRAITIEGKPEISFIPTQIRVDHNSMMGGGGNPGCIVTFGQVYGVIDHNNFTDCSGGVFGWGAYAQDEVWTDAYSAGGIFAGTANAMFVEDNIFNYTPALNGGTIDAAIYIQQGAQYVSRYNVFDASSITVNYIGLMYNHHGNQAYCSTSCAFRGQPIFESYGNVARCAPYNCDIMGIRGGSVLIHDEILTAADSGYAIEFNEEECWQTAFFSPLRTAWPGQDQVMNSFIWNVSMNGRHMTDIAISPDNGGCSAAFIQKDRDYFMHVPCGASDTVDPFGNLCTHGKESFTGSRYGGSTEEPTHSDTGSMTFSPTGDNAYYPYAPYTYPHPLTTCVDCNACISMIELNGQIAKWLQGQATISSLMEVIHRWKSGCA
jgi:hypothetical protein